LIRQGLHFEDAIAVILNASSSDRFDDFTKNVECVFPKLNVNVELIRKGA
jgi:malic enzyme